MVTRSPQPKWSQEEVDTGENILNGIKNLVDTKTVTDKYAQASISARVLGYLPRNQTFKNLPPEIKSYIEYIWWLETDKGKANLSEKRIKENLAEMKKNWAELYENNSDFKHAMTHPDDDN